VAEAKLWIDDYIKLEQTIADLIDRKKNLPEDSAEYQLIERELRGLRYSREEAGGIMEDLDHFGWGGYCRPLPATTATEPRQVLPFRKRSQQKQDSEELKEREQRKVDPRRQALVRQIAAGHPEWGPKELQELHNELDEWGE
jgi:hypothetical protein